MKSLTELLTGQTDITVYGNQEILILDIQQDSRLVKSGSLFVAQKGLLADGQATDNGEDYTLEEAYVNAVERSAEVRRG